MLHFWIKLNHYSLYGFDTQPFCLQPRNNATAVVSTHGWYNKLLYLFVFNNNITNRYIIRGSDRPSMYNTTRPTYRHGIVDVSFGLRWNNQYNVIFSPRLHEKVVNYLIVVLNAIIIYSFMRSTTRGLWVRGLVSFFFFSSNIREYCYESVIESRHVLRQFVPRRVISIV